MANITYDIAPSWQGNIPIEADTPLVLNNALQYANRLQRFAGAIVPFDAYVTQHRAGGQAIRVFNAKIAVDVDLSRCHKFLWTARHGARRTLPRDPADLEVFVVLTCVREDRPLYESKVCDVLFPGLWAFELWNTYLCLWYHNQPLLQSNPRCPQGLLLADHPNLTAVLGRMVS